ncbi:hypothetical protein ANCCEY_03157 [Ancylostoma ceylanicum]|uniref:Uncharacterized protein n=1 Tax=Ancylostoma ceylanicum TaxID=53326 RepID=A0A0D6M2M6_9BILA|nr:hypothetical protein ANCCEY_03157 [Ancylostoma ceylanicum]
MEQNSYASPICSVFSNDTQTAEVADEGQFPPDAFSLETRQRGAGPELHSNILLAALQIVTTKYII